MGRRVRAPRAFANLAVWGSVALLSQLLALYATTGWWLIASKWVLGLALVGSALALFHLSEVLIERRLPQYVSRAPDATIIDRLRGKPAEGAPAAGEGGAAEDSDASGGADQAPAEDSPATNG